MEDNKDDIEDIFRDRFSQEEAPVAPRVWDNIKKTLPKDNAGRVAEDSAKKYFLFSLIGVVFVAVAVLLVGKSYVKDEGNKKEEVSGKGIVVSEELKNKKEEMLNATNSEFIDSLEKNRFKNNNLSANENSNYSNDGRSDKTDSIALSATNKINKNNNLQNVVSNNVVTSNTKTDKSDENANMKNTVAVNNSKTDKTNKDDKNNKNLNTAVTANNNLKKLNKKTFSKNTLSEKSPVANNSLNKTNKNNNIQNSNSNNTSAINNSKKDTNRIENNKGGNQNLISYANKSVNKTENRAIVDADSMSTKQKNDDSLSVLAMSNKKKEKGLAINRKESDTLSAITKNSQEKDTAQNEQFLSQNKTNRDSVITSNVDSMLVVNPILTAGTDSLKKNLPDSILTKTSDSASVEEVKKEKRKIENRWSYDLLLSPMLTGATTKYLGTDSIVKSNVDSKNKQDKNRLDFSAGGMINYSINSRISISAGVIYSRYSETNKLRNSTSHDSTYYQYKKDTAGNIIDSSKIMQSITKKYASTKVDHYNFLSFPVNISFVLFNKTKLSLSVTGGVKVNMLLNGITYIGNASKTDLTEVLGSFHKVTLSYMASMGIEYKLKPKISLLAQPIVNFNMSSVYDRSVGLSQKPYSLGVNLGLRFKF